MIKEKIPPDMRIQLVTSLVLLIGLVPLLIRTPLNSLPAPSNVHSCAPIAVDCKDDDVNKQKYSPRTKK